MLTKYKTKEFSVDEYHRMIEVGIFREDENVELIEGEIVTMAPIGSLHAACVNRLNRLFSAVFGVEAIVAVQNPVIFGDYSEPQPDISLLKPRPDFYAARHPKPEEVYLVVEVADSSLEFDREIKLPLYSKAGIPEVWLANIPDGCVEVFSRPSKRGYKRIEIFGKEEIIESPSFPNKVFKVDDIL